LLGVQTAGQRLRRGKKCGKKFSAPHFFPHQLRTAYGRACGRTHVGAMLTDRA
jgi:hypothetical protein